MMTQKHISWTNSGTELHVEGWGSLNRLCSLWNEHHFVRFFVRFCFSFSSNQTCCQPSATIILIV